jgi:hypothetical protein
MLAANVENRLCNSLISMIISDNSAFFEGETEIRECPLTLPAKQERRKNWGAHAPRVQGSAPSLNPPSDVSDEGVADCTRGRVLSPRNRIRDKNCTKLH